VLANWRTLSLSLSLGGMWALDTFLRAVAEAVLRILMEADVHS
jgi:hypothetical protein